MCIGAGPPPTGLSKRFYLLISLDKILVIIVESGPKVKSDFIKTILLFALKASFSESCTTPIGSVSAQLSSSTGVNATNFFKLVCSAVIFAIFFIKFSFEEQF